MPELPRKQLIAAIGIALAAGTLALYSPTLFHAFINYDDPDYILDNPHVKAGLTWPGIVWAFKNSYAANWHPLTWISHMTDCQLFGLSPAGHHLINILFHATNTVLLFILLYNLTGAVWRSAFVAALFAWHPLHVESVAWASERKDVLSAFFWMLTLIFYARYAKARGSPKHLEAIMSYFLALLMFACGLMSKPMVVTLPFVLLLLDFWPLSRFADKDSRFSIKSFVGLILEKIPFFCLMLASCAITLFAQKNALWSASLPLDFRVANTAMAYVRYISKIFLPTDLALIYPYPHFWPQSGVIAAISVLVVLTLVFILAAKRCPYLIVGWLWFLGTLVPVIGLVQVGVQSMADRYTYLPAIGIFILVAWAANDLFKPSPEKVRICTLAGSAVLLACVVLTSFQLSYWRNSLTIFLHTVQATTDNYAADDCLGKTWENAGRLDRAQECYEEAVHLEPDFPMAQFDLGMNLLAMGHPADASNHLAIAVQLWPHNPDIQYDFGVFLWQRGNSGEAAKHFTAAMADRPDFTQARQILEQIQTNSTANHSTH
jgi:protein O-mannosyl-transferase